MHGAGFLAHHAAFPPCRAYLPAASTCGSALPVASHELKSAQRLSAQPTDAQAASNAAVPQAVAVPDGDVRDPQIAMCDAASPDMGMSSSMGDQDNLLPANHMLLEGPAPLTLRASAAWFHPHGSRSTNTSTDMPGDGALAPIRMHSCAFLSRSIRGFHSGGQANGRRSKVNGNAPRPKERTNSNVPTSRHTEHGSSKKVEQLPRCSPTQAMQALVDADAQMTSDEYRKTPDGVYQALSVCLHHIHAYDCKDLVYILHIAKSASLHIEPAHVENITSRALKLLAPAIQQVHARMKAGEPEYEMQLPGASLKAGSGSMGSHSSIRTTDDLSLLNRNLGQLTELLEEQGASSRQLWHSLLHQLIQGPSIKSPTSERGCQAPRKYNTSIGKVPSPAMQTPSKSTQTCTALAAKDPQLFMDWLPVLASLTYGDQLKVARKDLKVGVQMLVNDLGQEWYSQRASEQAKDNNSQSEQDLLLSNLPAMARHLQSHPGSASELASRKLHRLVTVLEASKGVSWDILLNRRRSDAWLSPAAAIAVLRVSESRPEGHEKLAGSVALGLTKTLRKIQEQRQARGLGNQVQSALSQEQQTAGAGHPACSTEQALELMALLVRAR